MFAKSAECPDCSSKLIVDSALFDSGIDLRCPECARYFAVVSPGTLSAAEVCGASVSIRIWRPEAQGD